MRHLSHDNGTGNRPTTRKKKMKNAQYTTLKALSELLHGTGYRLVLNGKWPHNYRLELQESNNEWSTCSSYRYAEQFFSCGLAADYIGEASAGCEGKKSQQLRSISEQMRKLCNA